MNPRLATLAELCRETVLPASVLVWLAAYGSGGTEYIKVAPIKAAPIVSRIAPALAADVRAAREPRPASTNAVIAGASVTEATSQATTGAAPQAAPPEHEQTPPSPELKPIVTASLSDPSEVLSQETPPAQAANEAAATSAALSNSARQDAKSSVDTVAVLDECFVVDTCVDRYLWALYQRTPKEDSVTSEEQRKVTVKRKGKLVTVTKTFSTVIAEDFSWKDPKAAEKASMSMTDYVIGGVDHDFKLRLFRMLHAAEEAGLSPGITSAFRDDYRQSIASGLKAANDRSYHGGSFRGGYGHGLAADVVSVNGANRAQRQASTEIFWKWIDTHGGEFGIGRPYLDRDPPHVAPIDGKEYADHNPKMRQAVAKERRGVAAHDDHGAAKRAKLARSS